jgi:hypothetical protein
MPRVDGMADRDGKKGPPCQRALGDRSERNCPVWACHKGLQRAPLEVEEILDRNSGPLQIADWLERRELTHCFEWS